MSKSNYKFYNATFPAKNKITDSLLIGLTFLTLPLLVISILYAYNYGWQNALHFHIGIYITLLVFAIFRNKVKNVKEFLGEGGLFECTNFSDLINLGKVAIHEGQAKKKGGELCNAENRSHEINESRIQILIQDTSETKKISSELNREKTLSNKTLNKFKESSNNTSDAIFIIDLNYNILTANQAFFYLLGITEKDLPDMKILNYTANQQDENYFNQRIKTLMDKTNSQIEYTIRNKMGNIFHIETKAEVINYSGQPAIANSFNHICEHISLQKEVTAAALKAEEKERERIAHELHDGLGPLLSTCRIHLHNLKNLKQAEEIEAVKNLGELIDDALTSITEILNNISPYVLRNSGIICATKNFIERINKKYQISFNYCFDPSERFNELKEITIYRIITELINNTIKHAKATQIKIWLEKKDKSLNLVYNDNGIGFNYEKVLKQNKGLGLTNIKSRINSLGGSISYQNEHNKGVNVIISLPLN